MERSCSAMKRRDGAPGVRSGRVTADESGFHSRMVHEAVSKRMFQSRTVTAKPGVLEVIIFKDVLCNQQVESVAAFQKKGQEVTTTGRRALMEQTAGDHG